MIPNLFITLKFYQLVGFILKLLACRTCLSGFKLKNFLKLVFKNEM
ncbi:membrane protein [Helicobacter pylori]|nr:membrane protein [Helicobacter pylori 26695-1]AJF09622.1 membrane protein [Helicobacter pylori 26695-1]AJF10264.1 membrane protein [Helicobacter pylori]AJF11162.1 membrane protein [Helicobacter pylori]